MSDIKEANHSSERVGKYTCTRCGWKWTPRLNSPDPPHACARCRSAYWQSSPVSSRANLPTDPKWHAERDVVARRRRERHAARLRELETEFGIKPSPIDDQGAIAPAPAKDLRQPAAIGVAPWIRFNDPPPPGTASTPAADERNRAAK
jgi:hypothetical protein